MNLVDLIITILTHPKAGGEIFMVKDDRDLSLPELIKLMAKVQGKKAYLFPVPVSIMRLMASLLKRKYLTDRLFGNLQVVIEKNKKLLNWTPPSTFEEIFSK